MLIFVKLFIEVGYIVLEAAGAAVLDAGSN